MANNEATYNWVEVKHFNLSSLEKKRIQEIEVAGKKIVLAKTANKLFAVDARCPHAGGHLCDGFVEGDHIVCPLHRYSFNLSTGRNTDPNESGIGAYPTKVENDKLLIGFKNKGRFSW